MLRRIVSRRGAAALAAGALAASLLLGLLLPIYTDEVGWRFQTRAGLDGGVDRFMAESCGPNTIARPPFFLMPQRYATAALNVMFGDPLFVRIAGVALALAWAALFWLLAGRIARGPEQADRLRVVGFSLLGFGVLPLLLVWSRPEQPLLLSLGLALLVASRRWTRAAEDDARRAWLVSFAILLLALVAAGFHMKGIVYSPVFAVAIALASRGRAAIVPRVAALALLGLLALVTLRYWSARFQCPADPALAAVLARENVASLLSAGGFRAGLAAWAAIDFHQLSPLRYVDVAMPARTYMSDWLVPGVIGQEEAKAWAKPLRIGWKAALAVSGLAAGRVLFAMARERRIEPRLVIGLTIGFVVIGWSLMQINKNAYEAALALPAAALGMVLILGAAAPARWFDRLLDGLGIALLAMALASQAALFVRYGPALRQAAATPGYLAAQPHSYSPYFYRSLEPEIVRAGGSCGIHPDRRPPGVLIDDLTYFTYMRSRRPLHRLGVLDTWNGGISDPTAYLRSKGSAGMVMGCLYLPPELRARARRTGQFCCIGLGR